MTRRSLKKRINCLQAKDYAAFLLTGVFATDPSDASATLLFDLVGGHWASDLIEALGLDSQLFPEVHASTDVIGHVTPAAASASGLLAGTPVVIGGGDGACATVGSGSVQDRARAYAYLGSSSWIAVTSRQPIYDPQQRTYTMAHLIPGYYFPARYHAGSRRIVWLAGTPALPAGECTGSSDDGCPGSQCTCGSERPFIPALPDG